MDDMDEIFRLLNWLNWLNSCEAKGHEWVRLWTSSDTAEIPLYVPITCARCGCSQG